MNEQARLCQAGWGPYSPKPFIGEPEGRESERKEVATPLAIVLQEQSRTVPSTVLSGILRRTSHVRK